MSEWLSLSEIATDLNIPIRTIHFYRQRGDFPAYRFGKRTLRVRREDYDMWKAGRLAR